MNRHDSVIVRRERPEAYREVDNLVREAFWNVYTPGCVELRLRNDPDFAPEQGRFRLPLPGTCRRVSGRRDGSTARPQATWWTRLRPWNLTRRFRQTVQAPGADF